MLMFLHSFHPSPILAELGPFLIRWYGVFLALGAAVGYLVTLRQAKRYGWSSDAVLTLVFWTLIIGFLGARLYHVANEPAFYLENPVLIPQVWRGGLAIHGGLIAGVLVLWWFARRWKVPLLRFTDLFAPAIAIGQAIGRWGNYFNQELFGRPTNLPWGIPIDPANRPPGAETAEFFHPTFLYESLWLVGVFVLLLLASRVAQRRGSIFAIDGIRTFGYLAFAALGRLGTELLRIDDTPIILGIRLPFIVSAGIVLASAVCLWYCISRSRSRLTTL